MDSFLYIWNDSVSNRFYIGVHKGDINDGYICSSRLMKEEYKKRPHDFSRVIVSSGGYEDMLNQEALILSKVNARENSRFYNQHNGDGRFYNKGHTAVTRSKISAAHMGKPKAYSAWNKGKTGYKMPPASEERKMKIGLANKGRKRPDSKFRPLTETEEQLRREKIGQTMKLVWANRRKV